MQKFLTSFITGIIAIFLLNNIKLIFIAFGLPIFWTNILGLILLLEVVAKCLLFKAVPPFVVQKTNLDAHRHLNLDLDRFHAYCGNLEAIGFKKITDYTSPAIQGMARLFYFPQDNCYAEVGMLAGNPVFCSIVSGLERGWFVAATNNNPSTSIKAISCVFLGLPHTIYKIFDEEPKQLLESFLAWQSEIKHGLKVETIAIADPEMYFTWEANKRTKQRQRLMSKSIIVSLVKMFLFSLQPKSEWLGEYPKYSK